MENNKPELSYEFLYEEFIVKDKTGKEIGVETGYHYATIYKNLKRFNIVKTKKTPKSKTLPQEEIVSTYLDGVPMIKIGDRFDVSEWTIKKILTQNNVEVRGVGYQSQTDQTLLEKIDSEFKAYYLGLLLADGSVTNQTTAGNYQTISLELHKKDRYILEKLSKEIKGNPQVKDSLSKNTSYFRVNGVELVRSVEKYGLTQNKSKTLNFLTDLVPEHLYHHFMRGLFDGDGTANSKGYIGYNAANKDFVLAFRSKVAKETGARQNGIYFGTVFFTTWGAIKDRKAIYNYLYKDATFFLKRKEEKIRLNF